MNLFELIGNDDMIQKTNLSRKITIGGKTIAYPVYKIRLDLLFYNDKNDRIATWLTQYSNDSDNIPFEELSKDEFNSIIEKFIIESNPSAIEKTKNNIALVNQREPGVVLYDGRIIDGNRRFTCLRLLHRNDPEVNYFETIILDKDIGSDQKQIKMLELSIQHGEEQRVEYNLIDLTIGAYHDITETGLLTIEEYASSTNESVAEVKKRLDVAELIIDFLSFIGSPKQYHIARELEIYTLMYEAIPLLKNCETYEEKENLKTVIYNNIVMNTIVDGRKFIRNLKKMMNEGVIGAYVKRQNKLSDKIEEARSENDFHSVGELKQFAETNADISEDMSVSMERSLTNMKKKQLRGKPSQAISKSISTLMDIDADVIEILSDKEKQKLGTQLRKLNNVVSELNTVCEDDEITVSESPNTKHDETKNIFPMLAVSRPEQPFVYCKDVDKTITNLVVNLSFGVFRYSDVQSESAEISAFFVDSDGTRLCDIIDFEVKDGEMKKVPFELNSETSSKKECFLIIKAQGGHENEALAILPFKINISFSLDFSF